MKSGNEKMKKASLLAYAGILCLLCVVAGCRAESEEEKGKISSIEFDIEKVEVNVNEDVIVKVIAKTEEGKRNEKIQYTSINEGFVEIREESNDGFVVRGLKAGTTIIKAATQNIEKMLEVRIYGENVLARYIKLDKPVLEVNEGSQIQTNVSLYGRVIEPDDNSLFQWQVEAGKNNIAINTTGNIAVIRGIERGFQEIVVSHPRADFDNKILVFVKGVDEEIKYIYRDSNILMLPNDGQYHDFDVTLINGKDSEKVGFEYTVSEGAENIEEISGQQTKCHVMAKKAGFATITVSHEMAVVDFDIRVIIYDVEIPYIELDESFVLLTLMESANVGFRVINARNDAYKDQFKLKIVENNVIKYDENEEKEEQGNINDSILEIIKYNESIYIRAKQTGTSRIIISNNKVQTPREILVVVRELMYEDNYYIETTQNVITTQIGDPMTRIDVRMINGNSGHANSFVWEVEDSTVAYLYTGHGTAVNRAMALGTVFNASASIEPRKVGTTKVVITNTSFPNLQVQIIVRVFPAGTFVDLSLVSYPGLIKVEYGKMQPVNLTVERTTKSGLGSLDWSTDDPDIAQVFTGIHGPTNTIQAMKEKDGGITKMTVKNTPGSGNIEFPVESIVIAGDEDYINRTQVIYVNDFSRRVLEQQTIDIHILNSKLNANNEPDETWQPYGFRAVVKDPSKVYAVMSRNVLKVMGKERGTSDITIYHDSSANLSINLHITVEPASISIDQPYYISSADIKGVVRNVRTGLPVTMPGAPPAELNKLVWSSEDSSIVEATGAGSEGLLLGKVSGRQAFVTVSHKEKKAESKDILVYVVESADELNNVILGVKQESYLIKTGGEQVIPLITNATDAQKRHIEWAIKTKPGDNVPIEIEPNFDVAIVRALCAGNATLEVTYTDYETHDHSPDGTCTNPTGKYTLPLSIYISVTDTLGENKVIKGPAVIELIRGESKIIGLEHFNLVQNELNQIKWEVIIGAGEEPLANIEGNGDSAYLYALRRGVGKVKIWQSDLRWEHYATLVCANSLEELLSMYVMGVDATYHKMMIGEEKKVSLTFGSNGFPETSRKNLMWTADSSGKVKVVGSGEKVSIVAQEPGEATVKVRDMNNPKVSFNEELELKFLVIDPANSTLEFRGHQKMLGIVVGQSAQVDMHLYDNDAEIKNYDLWEHEVEAGKEHIVRVNRLDGSVSGQKLDILAQAVGEVYVTVRYDNRVSARILVYTALTADDLLAYYPILVEKTNYLLQMGQKATVKIETMEEKDAANFSKVSWGVENAGVIGGVDFTEKINGVVLAKKEVEVTGTQAGNCIITVNYNGEAKARIFVTVVSNDIIDMEKYMVTESIIGMYVGESRTTRIFHNLGSDVSKVLWDKTKNGIVNISGSGEQVTLTAVAVGETYVTVSYGTWLKRHIRVYVCADAPSVETYKAMNIENQYVRAGVGETLSLQVFFAKVKSAQPTLWNDKYENKVVKTPIVEKDNGAKVEITTQNEGVAVFEVINMGISDPTHIIRLYIEVSNKYNNAPRPVVERFLTTQKTVYVMNPDHKNEELNLYVSGVGYDSEEMLSVLWQLNSEKSGTLIELFPNGPECRVRVNPLGLEGTAEIRVSKTENEILIRIVVSKTGLLGFPYITGDDTIQIGLNQKKSVVYDVAETASYDQESFHVQVMSGGAYVEAKFNKNVLEIEGKLSGQALLRITCQPIVDAQHYKDVAVLVTTTLEGIIYLTTHDNFTQVKIGEVKTIEVEMVGINNPTESGYDWYIDPKDKKYIEIINVGRQAQVKGLEAGQGRTVRITVRNREIPDIFALTMWVRVSNNYFNTKYLTTTQNIVQVTEGRSMYLTAELVNGAPGEETQITWQCYPPDGDIAEVMGTGTQAYVLGKHLGFARIRACYEPAVNQYIEILVIVEADTSSDQIYITSDFRLIEMKPGATREISVRLVGGGVGDEYGFQWMDYVQNPVEKNRKVIEIYGALTGTDRTLIRALNEGEATIRVTHPKTSFILDLKVYVQEHNGIEFSSDDIRQGILTIVEGAGSVLTVTMPPNTTIRYEVSKPGIISLSNEGPTSSGFLEVTGLAPGNCLLTAVGVNKVMTAELVVSVKANEKKAIQYIRTNDSIFNMINWESVNNRAIVTGLPVGEKDDGTEFIEADSMGLVWDIEGNNRNIIEFDTTALGDKVSTVGKMASIKAKKTGTAEIKISHPQMKKNGYQKKVYINVLNYDGNFNFSPLFVSMQIGEDKDFEVNITGNIDDTAYKNVLWKLKSDEKDVYGVEFFNVQAPDTKYEKQGKAGMKTVKIIAKKDGVFKLKTIYEGNEIEAIIYVEKAKILEVYDKTLIEAVPNSTLFIKLYHEPLLQGLPYNEAEKRYPGEQFKIENEWHQYAEIVYCGPIREMDSSGNMVIRNWLQDNFDYEISYGMRSIKFPIKSKFEQQKNSTEYPDYNGLLVVHTTEREGITRITIKHQNIERIVTINNSTKYAFNMLGVMEGGVLRSTNTVRGKPGETVTIKYEIRPETEIVTNGWKNSSGVSRNGLQITNGVFLDNAKSLVSLPVIESQMMITMSLLACGSTELAFSSDIYGENYLKIPVYIAYETMNVQWVANNPGKSRMDSLQNAIYVANNEEIQIRIRMDNNNNFVYGYPNDDVEIVSIKFGTDVITTDSERPYSFGEKTMMYYRFFKRASNTLGFNLRGINISGETNNKPLLKVEYYDVLTITYNYTNSGGTKTTVNKNFLVYRETY